MKKLLYLFFLMFMSVSCSNKLNINGITVYPDSVSIVEGDSMRINAVIDFSGGKYNEPDLIKLTWSSDNNEIATVDTTGYVRTHAIGTAIIMAACDDKSAQCTVTVIEDTTKTEQTPEH